MDQPVVSLCASTIRPQNWLYLYNNASSSIPFEMVFVGPNEPDFILPDNFKYIKSNVKPTQCTEIAIRHASGKFVMHIADDQEFVIDNPLGRLYDEYLSYNNENLILSPRYMMNGSDCSYECHHYPTTQQESPLIPISGFFPREIYLELGGIDKNFIVAFHDYDVAYRFYNQGGTVVLSDNVWVNENSSLSFGVSRILSQWGVHDQKLLESLWMVDGKTQLNRSVPFEPFINENILTESQGPKGIWI
jgi:hypothetical protein